MPFHPVPPANCRSESVKVFPAGSPNCRAWSTPALMMVLFLPAPWRRIDLLLTLTAVLQVQVPAGIITVSPSLAASIFACTSLWLQLAAASEAPPPTQLETLNPEQSGLQDKVPERKAADSDAHDRPARSLPSQASPGSIWLLPQL